MPPHPPDLGCRLLLFFEPEQLEMLAKIFDGRPVNQRFLYGALSTVCRNRHGTLTSTEDMRAIHENPYTNKALYR
jgi:hypothetical protein